MGFAKKGVALRELGGGSLVGGFGNTEQVLVLIYCWEEVVGRRHKNLI